MLFACFYRSLVPLGCKEKFEPQAMYMRQAPAKSMWNQTVKNVIKPYALLSVNNSSCSEWFTVSHHNLDVVRLSH